MSALDSAIAQHLQNLKAANPALGRLNQPGHAPFGAPGMPGSLPVTGPPPLGAHLALQPVPGVQTALGPGGVAPGAGPPVLSVAVNGLPFRYVLSEADLRDMCQRWGQVQVTQIYREGAREVGVVTFAEPIDAADCQRQLNGHQCSFEGVQGALAAVLGSPEQLSPPLHRQPGGMPMPGGTLPAPGTLGAPTLGIAGPGQMPTMGGTLPMPGGPAAAPPGMTMGMDGNAQMPQMGMPGMPVPGAGGPPLIGGMPASPSGSLPKSAPMPMEAMMGKGKGKGAPMNGKGSDGWPAAGWSCKVIVQAERMHPDFPTAAKIVGNGSANVEHIRNQANCMVELRGLSSGTMEPTTGQELQEPMFLSLSSDSAQNGESALDMVKDLLGSIYEEHQKWCRTHNLRQGEGLTPEIIVQDSSSTSGPPGPNAGGPNEDWASFGKGGEATGQAGTFGPGGAAAPAARAAPY
mmetsp:Transcript_108322/g.208200  ORF Transcript_108322/g.208200 Transcript_108322/m.208200 type:complete len:461 (-) Transcript_108322:72-1454(-)